MSAYPNISYSLIATIFIHDTFTLPCKFASVQSFKFSVLIDFPFSTFDKFVIRTKYYSYIATLNVKISKYIIFVKFYFLSRIIKSE